MQNHSSCAKNTPKLHKLHNYMCKTTTHMQRIPQLYKLHTHAKLQHVCKEHPTAVQQQQCGGTYRCSSCLSLMTSQNLAKNKSPSLLRPRSQGAAGFKATSMAHSPDDWPTSFLARSWGCQPGRARTSPGTAPPAPHAHSVAPQCWSVPSPPEGGPTPLPHLLCLSPEHQGLSLAGVSLSSCHSTSSEKAGSPSTESLQPDFHSITTREPVATGPGSEPRWWPVRVSRPSVGTPCMFCPPLLFLHHKGSAAVSPASPDSFFLLQIQYI